MGFAIPRLRSGGIITNYNCTSQCGHCLYNCSPRREKEYLTVDKMARILAAIKAKGCPAVHIGGGEPMLHPEKLGELLGVALKCGVRIEYVETNSSWYTGPQKAREILTKLRRKGLRTLLVSISPFHHQHIPYRCVEGVMAACRETGIGTFPWIAAFGTDLAAFGPDLTPSAQEYTEKFGEDYFQGVLQRYWIHMGGRALATYGALLTTHGHEGILKDNPGSCARELADTSHFHIDLFGNYIPGLCAGLAIDMVDLGKALPDGKYPLIEALAHVGIGGLFELAAGQHGFQPAPAGYINNCHLCTHIRAHLHGRDGRRLWPELAPDGFYAEWQDSERAVVAG